MAEPPPSPMTDEQIRAVKVGELRPLGQPIEIADYDPLWPGIFAGEATKIRRALGERARRIEHAGSTSVPGLAAKPLIDIVLVVDSSADEASYVPVLEAAGYTLRTREPDWYEHRMLRGREPSVNLHVFSTGCEEIERMLAFRDWLRANEDDRRLYEQTKRNLATRNWKYGQNYADAKTEVVRDIMSRALPR
jgi:GrpB-like predicted nucleotidyltransferase (UPF0157 family)